MPWNPNAPDTTGMEWRPHAAEVATVGPEGSALAVLWEAETTRQLVALGAAVQVTSPGDWTMELYTEADYQLALADAVQHAAFSPTADLHVHPATWSWPTDAAPYYQWLGGTPGSAGNANKVTFLSPSKPPYTDAFYAGRYSGLAIPAGQRLLQVRLLNDRQVWNSPDPNNVAWQEYGFADPSDGSGRITSEERISTGAARQTVEYTFRPRTVLAASDHAASLARWAGVGSGWGLFYNSYSGTNLQMDMWHHQLVADYVPERRLAWGTGVQPGATTASGQLAVGPLGNVFTQLATRGGAAVTITAGVRYVLLLRGPKYDDSAPFVGRVQTLAPGPPITGYVGGRVAMARSGLPLQAVPADSIGAPLYTTQTGPPTIAPDSDPFPVQGVSPVLAGVPASQTLQVATAGSYGQLVVTVARPNYPNASPLLLRVIDDATGQSIGGAVQLDTARWDAIPSPYTLGGRVVKDVRVDLPGPVQLAVGAYRVEASTADAFPLSDADPWGVLYLEGLTASYSPPPAFDPGGLLDARNSATVLVLQPPAPQGATCQLRAEVAGQRADCPWWDVADVSWEATDLGDTFLRYEVERQQRPDTGTWERVAHIEDESVVAFTDREAMRAVAVRYRVRVMRTDGGTSQWAPTPVVTPEAYCCGIGFATNDAAVPVLFFPDVEPMRTYENLDADLLVLRPVYARDYQLAFRPAERRGVRLNTQLLVANGTDTAGLAEYDQLRELARTVAPICVLDEVGTRFWAALQCPELSYSPYRGQQVYYSTVVATQLADQATIHTVAPPPEPLPVAGTFHMGDHANDKLDSNFFMGFS